MNEGKDPRENVVDYVSETAFKRDPIFLRRYWVGLGGVLSQLTLHFAYVRGDNFVIKLSYLFIADVLNLIIVWRSET